MAYRTGKTVKCEKCGKKHWITEIELSFYMLADLESPKVCRSCRVSTAGQTEMHRSHVMANTGFDSIAGVGSRRVINS